MLDCQRVYSELISQNTPINKCLYIYIHTIMCIYNTQFIYYYYYDDMTMILPWYSWYIYIYIPQKARSPPGHHWVTTSGARLWGSRPGAAPRPASQQLQSSSWLPGRCPARRPTKIGIECRQRDHDMEICRDIYYFYLWIHTYIYIYIRIIYIYRERFDV